MNNYCAHVSYFNFNFHDYNHRSCFLNYLAIHDGVNGYACMVLIIFLVSRFEFIDFHEDVYGTYHLDHYDHVHDYDHVNDRDHENDRHHVNDHDYVNNFNLPREQIHAYL